MRKRTGMLLAAVLTLGMAATGCGSKGAEEGGSAAADTTGFLTTAVVADFQTIDVQKTSKDYMVPFNIYDRLVDVEVDADGVSKIAPALAESWDISEDGLEYTLHLRKDVKFHNDAEFTSEDVAYSLNRLLTVEGGTNSEFVDQIKGAADLFEGKTTELEGVEIVDEYTVKITLKEAYAGFLACLSSPGVSMYDSESTEKAGDQFGLDAAVTVGTGPFKLSSWTVNDQVVLVKNDSYWRGAPALPGIIIKVVPDTETQTMMFESEQLDVIDLDFVQDAADRFIETYPDQIISGPRVGITYFTMNQNIEPFNKPEIRKAVQMAINRQEILDTLYSGRGVVEQGIFPHGLIGFNETQPVIPYDKEAAKALLADAGYPNGFDMELAADSSASDTVTMALEIMKAQLAEVGINAEIKNYDQSTWLETRNAGELGSFMSTWSADYNDPDNFIYTFFGNAEKTKTRSLNYPDQSVMDRVQAARSIVDTDERIKEYQDLEIQLVHEDAAWVPMYSRTHLFAVGKGVEGFTVPWNGASDLVFYNVSMKK